MIIFTYIMIKVGKDGSIVLFWEDLLISSVALGKYSYEDYLREAHYFIECSLRRNHNIRDLVLYSKNFCDTIYKRKKQKKKICSQDHQAFAMSVFALIKLNLIDDDDVLLFAPRRKSRKT